MTIGHSLVLRRLLLSAAGLGLTCVLDGRLLAAEKGHPQQVAVQAETRIDWGFAVANQSPDTASADWLPQYDSTQQRYELFVPQSYTSAKSSPLVLFISPNKQATWLSRNLLFFCERFVTDAANIGDRRWQRRLRNGSAAQATFQGD